MPDRASYIVTGGAGFIGANLVAALLARDPHADITVIDDLRAGSYAAIGEACARRAIPAFTGRFLTQSTHELDWPAVIDAARPSAVFHLAAITDTTLADEREMLQANVGGFPELLAACAARSIPLVYASSAATYGTPPQARDRTPFPESAAGHPNNVYGFSKWQMENEHRRAALAADPHRPPHFVGLRYFNVFGPGESRKGRMASMPYQLTRQILAGGPPRVFADGSQARDQIHVDDVVACTIAAAAPAAKPGVYNLGSGTATSFNQVCDAIRDGLGVKRPTEYFDMPADIRRFYQDYTCADMSAAKSGLSWSPKIPPLGGIAAYARWLRDTRG